MLINWSRLVIKKAPAPFPDSYWLRRSRVRSRFLWSSTLWSISSSLMTISFQVESVKPSVYSSVRNVRQMIYASCNAIQTSKTRKYCYTSKYCMPMFLTSCETEILIYMEYGGEWIYYYYYTFYNTLVTIWVIQIEMLSWYINCTDGITVRSTLKVLICERSKDASAQSGVDWKLRMAAHAHVWLLSAVIS